MTKRVEIKDLTIGTGDEATKQSVVVANVRMFLRRGDEVSYSPLFGPRMVMNLGQREAIAGLRSGIPGMRVGGTREIVISPHLAYGETGIPGRIPPNALLRCEVELLEIRQFNALLPHDWLPGKILMLRRCRSENNQDLGWSFIAHEDGNAVLNIVQIIPGKQRKQLRCTQMTMEAAQSAELIQRATSLPEQLPEACVPWNPGFIDTQNRSHIVKDVRSGARCLVIEIIENGKHILITGVHEESPAFLDSVFYRTIDQLIRPHLDTDSVSA